VNTQSFDDVKTKITHRLRNQVNVDQGTTECLPIQNGFIQGCILSPGLFNLYSEYIKKQ